MQICVHDELSSQQKYCFLLFLPVCLLCHCMATFGIVIYKYFCFYIIIISSTVKSTFASAIGIHVFSEKECHSRKKIRKAKQG